MGEDTVDDDVGAQKLAEILVLLLLELFIGTFSSVMDRRVRLF
jgi:hypothetical protein